MCLLETPLCFQISFFHPLHRIPFHTATREKKGCIFLYVFWVKRLINAIGRCPSLFVMLAVVYALCLTIRTFPYQLPFFFFFSFVRGTVDCRLPSPSYLLNSLLSLHAYWY